MQQIKPTFGQIRPKPSLSPFPGGEQRPGAAGRQLLAQRSLGRGQHPGKTGWAEAPSASRPRKRSPRRGRRRRNLVGAGLGPGGRVKAAPARAGDVSWKPRPLELLPLFHPCGSVWGALVCARELKCSVPAAGISRGSQPNTSVCTA